MQRIDNDSLDIISISYIHLRLRHGEPRPSRRAELGTRPSFAVCGLQKNMLGHLRQSVHPSVCRSVLSGRSPLPAQSRRERGGIDFPSAFSPVCADAYIVVVQFMEEHVSSNTTDRGGSTFSLPLCFHYRLNKRKKEERKKKKREEKGGK